MQPSLLALISANPCAFSVICIFGRTYPRCRNMSSSRVRSILLGEGENYSNEQIVEGLRQMANADLGVLRWNSDADEFTFAWALSPAAVIEMLRTGQSIDAVSSNFGAAGEDDFQMDIVDPLQMHKFQLRDGCVIGFELPDNLTKREARKIFKFLKALAYQVPAWPFPIFSKLRGLDDGPDKTSEVEMPC